MFAGFLVVTPVVGFAQIVPCDGPNCDWNALIKLGQNILNFMVTISVFVAAIMFAYAGWLFFSDSGNASNIEKGKKIFGAIVIGLIIVLIAWLVIDTLLQTLTGRGLDERSQNPTGAFIDTKRSIV
jgi:hypothetical protein